MLAGCPNSPIFATRTEIPPGYTSDMSYVSCGRDHTCAISSAGHLVCFGYNPDGRLDIPVGYETGIATVVAGNAATCAITVAGNMSCWGE